MNRKHQDTLLAMVSALLLSSSALSTTISNNQNATKLLPETTITQTIGYNHNKDIYVVQINESTRRPKLYFSSPEGNDCYSIIKTLSFVKRRHIMDFTSIYVVMDIEYYIEGIIFGDMIDCLSLVENTIFIWYSLL